MAYYLGLDAGGTKTECALADDSTILARATAGTIKVMRTSNEEAEHNLQTLLQNIASQSGIALASIACTCVGLAGISVSRVADWVLHSLCIRVGGRVLLAGDEEIALDAAFSGGPGVLVIAGTGSNLAARTSYGHLIHIGGWGPAVADEGSGNWIGKQAVRAVFDAVDRAKPTLLQKAILREWGLVDLAGLIDRANASPSPDFSRLTRVVVACAEEGDPYANRILRQAGEDLGMYAALAIQRVIHAENSRPESGAQRSQGPPHDLPEVAFSGSILSHIPAVWKAMSDAIHRKFPNVRIHSKAVDPVEGALWRARQAILCPTGEIADRAAKR